MATNSLQSLRARYGAALKAFVASSRAFEILGTVPVDPPPTAPKVLYVLDSSFNPPTLAHLRIASSALAENPGSSSRLLLLLATQNADKPSKPALFEDRLVMMDLLARDLRSRLSAAAGGSAQDDVPQIDIGVTKKPYFVDKAAEIERAGVYPKSIEQVHLTGYDTLIRIFNPKYYPPEHTLKPLEPFLAQNRLRVTMRPDDEWGGREEQEAYLRDIAQGSLESLGGKREWAQRIQLVEGAQKGEEVVSSTKAREAAKSGQGNLDLLVPSNVRDYVISQELYKDD
ncbi:putative cytidylyltransferase [Thermoascus aurantiacus ATCC 26904]